MTTPKGLAESRRDFLYFDDIPAFRWGGFLIRDATQILGLSRRKVLLIFEQDLVTPLNITEVGRGVHRRLSLVHIFRMYVIMELEHLGYTPKRMKPLLELVESVGLEANRAGIEPSGLLRICSDRSGGFRVADDPAQCSVTITLNLEVMFRDFVVLLNRHFQSEGVTT